MRFFGSELGGREPDSKDSIDSAKEELVEYYTSLREGVEKKIKKVENLNTSLQIWKRFFETKNMEKEVQLVEKTEQMLKDYQEIWKQQYEILASIEDMINISDNLDKAKKFAEKEHKKLNELQQIERKSIEELVKEIGEIQKIGNKVENFEEEFKKIEDIVLAETEEKTK